MRIPDHAARELLHALHRFIIELEKALPLDDTDTDDDDDDELEPDYWWWQFLDDHPELDDEKG